MATLPFMTLILLLLCHDPQIYEDNQSKTKDQPEEAVGEYWSASIVYYRETSVEWGRPSTQLQRDFCLNSQRVREINLLQFAFQLKLWLRLVYDKLWTINYPPPPPPEFSFSTYTEEAAAAADGCLNYPAALNNRKFHPCTYIDTGPSSTWS